MGLNKRPQIRWRLAAAFLCLCHAVHEYVGRSAKGDQQLGLANGAIIFYDYLSLYCGSSHISTFTVMDFQKILVGLTFAAAVLFLLRKFVWTPMTESRKKSLGTLDGGRTKCGSDDCQCH